MANKNANKKAAATTAAGRTLKTTVKNVLTAKAPIEKKYLENQDGIVTIEEGKDGEMYFVLRTKINHGVISGSGKSFLLSSSHGTAVLLDESSTAKKKVPVVYDAGDFQGDIMASFNFMVIIPREFRPKPIVGAIEEEEE